jgi:hypothetical protein
MTKMHYRTRKVCAFIIGVLFFCSGIFKLLDPVGTGLIVGSYYKFFHLSFLDFSAKTIAVTLSLTETLVGACLITRIWRKSVAYIAAILIGFFTFIALTLFIFNPNMDCGCFGEVIHLTHWQTLLKNLILCALAAGAFIPFKNLGHPKRSRYVSFGLVTGAVLLFTLYSLMSIPLLDFTSYAVDSEIVAGQGNNKYDFDEYTSNFIYDKNGKRGAFTLDHLPDSTWKYVKTETIKMDNPFNKISINNLSFSDASGNYKDDLAAKGKVMIVSSYSPRKLTAGQWTKIFNFLYHSKSAGFKPLMLTASTPEGLEISLDKVNLGQSEKAMLLAYSYFADYKTLISLNRSNGGATYYYDGELVSKWARMSLPDKNELQGISNEDQTSLMLKSSSRGRVIFESFLFYVFMVMIFV